MKALKYILFTLVGLAALFVLLGLFARNNYHIERSAEIDAPREIVYEQLRFFKHLPNWSPWQQMDPDMKTSIEGTDGEAGAVYKWSGNKKVGSGSQTFKSVQINRIDLEVTLNDFSTSPVYFNLAEKDKKTTVTWAMDMHVPFPWNAFAMLTDVNAFVGKDYEVGLANLKRYCEALAPKKYRGYEVKEAEQPETHYALVRAEVEFPQIPAFFGENFGKAIAESGKAGAQMSGHPCGFFWTYDTLAMKTDMAAAIPIDKQVKPANGVQTLTLGGRTAVIEYFGDYALTAEAHNAMDEYLADKKLQYLPPVVEEYVTDPGQEPDTAKWLTRIIYFVAPKEEKQN
jgi:effector-binding domain-containing protein